MGDDLEVSGGVGGIEAHYASMLRYATVLDDAGDTLLEANGTLLGLAVDGDLAEAAIMCPLEVGGIEASLATATVGPDSALWAASEFEVLARFLRGAVDAYAYTDELQARLPLTDVSWPMVFGFALDTAGLVIYSGRPDLRPLLDGLELTPPESLAELIYDNPWVAEALTRMAPGLIQGAAFGVAGMFGPAGPALLSTLSGGHWPTGDYESAISGLIALAGLGGAFQDTGDFTVAPVDGSTRQVDFGPSTLSTIFTEQSLLSPDDGQIQIVRIDRGPGLPPSYVVQIPGTQDWSPTRRDNR